MSKNSENNSLQNEQAAGPCTVCKQPTTRKCSVCHLIFYCTIEHQKDHSNEHKSSCKPFQMLQSAALGRYLAAARDLSVGEEIFAETPLVFGPKPLLVRNGDSFPCVGCCQLISQENAVQCSECLWPVCSFNCDGLKEKLGHGLECALLKLRKNTSQLNFYEFFRFDTLIILRALFLQSLDKAKFELLLKLEDHLDKRDPGSDVFKVADEKARFLYKNYSKLLKENEEVKVLENFSIDLIHKIYAILDINSIEINGNISAAVLYCTASLLEHNCTPNTFQIIDSRDGYKITLKAAIPIKENENITTSYVNILWGTHQRRSFLKNLKYFSCCCDRCKDPTEFGTYFSALKCLGSEKDPCGGTQLPANPLLEEKLKWICDKCKIKLPNAEIIKFIDHLGGEVEKNLAKKPSFEELKDLLDKLLMFLHPNHFHIFTVKRQIVQFQNSKEIEVPCEFLKEKIKICRDLREIAFKLDPGKAQLGLLLGEVLHEMFIAEFALIQRKNFQTENLANLNDILEEIDSVLEIVKIDCASQELNNSVKATKAGFLQWKENKE